MKKEDIEFITPNVLDLESFIRELLSERSKKKPWAKDLIVKLQNIETKNTSEIR